MAGMEGAMTDDVATALEWFGDGTTACQPSHGIVLAREVRRLTALDGWTPTPAAVNALPDPLRRYIHDLETRCDPAGETQQRICAEDAVRGLDAEVRRLTALVDEASHQFTLAKHVAPCSNGLLCPWCAVDRWQAQANEDHTAHVAEMLHQRERATAEIDRLTALVEELRSVENRRTVHEVRQSLAAANDIIKAATVENDDLRRVVEAQERRWVGLRMWAGEGNTVPRDADCLRKMRELDGGTT